MKDSQRGEARRVGQAKYIKANNERFSTTHPALGADL